MTWQICYTKDVLAYCKTYTDKTATVITPKAKKLELVIRARPNTPSAVV